MSKIDLCPGKIPIRNDEQPWYAPIGDYPSNYVLCECCYKHYGKSLDPICYKVVYGEKYYCSCSLRTFDKSSIVCNNIRVSVINPDNFFRYRMSKRKSEIIFHIPKDERYQIIVENMDVSETANSKISVDLVNYDNDVEVRYYDKKYPYYLIIDNEDYMAYNNLSKIEQHVDFVVRKWFRPSDPYMKAHYVKDENETYFEITLNFCDNEKVIMDSIIEINKSLPDKTGRIIVIDNFV